MRLGVDAALALVVRHLPTPWCLGDAMLFANGRLRRWPGWRVLEAADREQIARYLRLRPEALADRQTFFREAADSLSGKTRFYATAGVASGLAECKFSPVNGKAIEQLTAELLDSLAARYPENSPPVLPRSSSGSVSIQLSDRRSDFEVPVAHVQTNGASRNLWPKLIPAIAYDSIEFDTDRLLKLAGEIDRSGASEVPYKSILTKFFEQLEAAAVGNRIGQPVAISAGPTQLLIAPTGSGKSVFAHVAALDLAQRGIATAMVVPDIKTVMREAYRLEREMAALGWKLTVAPVNSTESLIEKATELLQYGSMADAFVPWALDCMAYPCQLSAYAQSGEPEWGEEPCFKLRQRSGGKERTVACPFAVGCPKFDSFRRAATADILVVNHAAFLVGKVPIPLLVEDRLIHKMPIMEFVFKRCGVVLVDEIDMLQHSAIKLNTGQLQLSGRRTVSPVWELLTQFYQAKAAGDLPTHLPVDGIRSNLHLICWLADEFADLINRGDVKWEGQDSLRWSGTGDAGLSKRLFGTDSGEVDRLDAVFGRVPIEGDEAEEGLRLVVATWSQRKIDDEPDTVDLRCQLMSVLSAWPRSLNPNDRSWVADALIQRAVLVRLERALIQLRPHLGILEQYGLEAAARVRDKLLGYATWTPSPLGPLGRRVVGFAFRRHADDPGALHARGLLGDPHGLIASLGDITGLALSGQERIVVGLSATAWFPGSPESHVLSPIWLVQPDESGGVDVQSVTVPDRDGKPVRVSGEASPSRRLARVAHLASSMWGEFLREHLSGLASNPSTRDRAKALLVTGSYPESQKAAEALSRAMGGSSEANRRIRYVVKASEAGRDPLESQAIPPRGIESFGKSEADVLIAPLAVIARGHNIVLPGSSGTSAIASIFVLVRPVPVDDAARVLAHVSYETNRNGRLRDAVASAIESERRHAEKCLYEIRKASGPFGTMPPGLRHAMLCDVLVDLAQLAGRCRRGGTDVRVFLVDGAFQDDKVGWDRLVCDAFSRWKSDGHLPQMMRIHRAFLQALRVFSGWEG